MKPLALISVYSLIVSSIYSAEDVPSIGKIIEYRDGKTSVYGLRVMLNWMQLESLDSIKGIKVIEHKHNTDITDFMEISVTRDLSCILIRFHDGKGDFGSGNVVSVIIDRKNLKKEWKDGDPLEFKIGTDK